MPRVRFAVVPDATTRALELRKGSADIAINALTSDTVVALETRAEPSQWSGRRARCSAYLAFNLRDPILNDVRVRQAIAYAIDRRPMIAIPVARFRATAPTAFSRHRAGHMTADVPHYDYDPERARQMLDAAGYPAVNGVRFHLTMKTSTEETTRLMVAVLQQQLRDVGIALDIRTFEFATFFADVTSGAFQLYSLRWIGGNEDPDIFEYVFHSDNFPPHGANRSFYSNPRVDAPIEQARRETDQQPAQGGCTLKFRKSWPRPSLYQPLVFR